MNKENTKTNKGRTWNILTNKGRRGRKRPTWDIAESFALLGVPSPTKDWVVVPAKYFSYFSTSLYLMSPICERLMFYGWCHHKSRDGENNRSSSSAFCVIIIQSINKKAGRRRRKSRKIDCWQFLRGMGMGLPTRGQSWGGQSLLLLL